MQIQVSEFLKAGELLDLATHYQMVLALNNGEKVAVDAFGSLDAIVDSVDIAKRLKDLTGQERHNLGMAFNFVNIAYEMKKPDKKNARALLHTFESNPLIKKINHFLRPTNETYAKVCLERGKLLSMNDFDGYLINKYAQGSPTDLYSDAGIAVLTVQSTELVFDYFHFEPKGHSVATHELTAAHFEGSMNNDQFRYTGPRHEAVFRVGSELSRLHSKSFSLALSTNLAVAKYFVFRYSAEKIGGNLVKLVPNLAVRDSNIVDVKHDKRK